MVTIQHVEKLETLQKVVEFLGNWQDRTKKGSLVIAFFRRLTDRRITAARKVLVKIQETSDSSMWRQGYLNALEGMVIALETKEDRNLFINQTRIERTDKLRETFLRQSKNGLQAEFDRGYFAAWTDYLTLFN